MLLPDPAVKGAMARLGAQLVDALRQLDADVVACRWGRHADRESPLASACGRVMDVLHIRRLLREGGSMCCSSTPRTTVAPSCAMCPC